jgi:hypothetical protein
MAVFLGSATTFLSRLQKALWLDLNIDLPNGIPLSGSLNSLLFIEANLSL